MLTRVTNQKVQQLRAARNDLRRQLTLLLEWQQAAAKRMLPATVVVTTLVSFLISAPRLYRTPLVTFAVSHHGGQLLVALTVLIVGLSAYWLKRNYQREYGIGEIIFAVATAYNIAENVAAKDAMLSKWTALGGAVYVVSRGMGNIMESRRRASQQQESSTAKEKPSSRKRNPPQTKTFSLNAR